MNSLIADLRYTSRGLRAAPMFTLIAAASIALAIGANAAVFMLLDQTLLRVLPARDPARIVQVTTDGDFYGGTMGDGSEMSYAAYVDLRDHNQVFAGMFARFPVDAHLGVGGRSERVRAEMVSGTYFPVLGVPAAIGRAITQDDDQKPGGHPVAMLSHTYWTSRFSSDPGVVGRTIVANGKPMTIIGVAADGFDGTDIGQPTQLFVPMAMHTQFAPGWLKQDDRRFRWVTVFARLRNGVTAEQAAAGLQPFFRTLLEKEMLDKAFADASSESKQRHLENRVEVLQGARGRSGLREYLTRPLWILMSIVGGVLLIACANVANLLIARGAARQREIALRLALGASRRRVVQQLLVEGVVLASIGGAVGLILASWGASFLLSFYSRPDNPLTISSGPDLRVLAFTFAIVGLTALLCSLLPSFQSTRPALTPTLKEGGHGVLGGGRAGLRKLLVVTQVGLSLLLLVGAGLFVRSLTALLSVHPGYTVDNVVTFGFDLERSGYRDLESKRFAKELLQRVRSTPGVSSAGFAFFGLLEGGAWGMGLTIEGHQPGRGQTPSSLVNGVSPGFFETLQIPLIAGRLFDHRDERSEKGDTGWPYRAAIVNESFVKRYLGKRNPLGVRLGFDTDPGARLHLEIVGVVKDAKYTGIREEPRPQLYVAALENGDVSGMTIYVRTTRGGDATIAGVRRAVQQLDASLPVFAVRSFETQLARSLANERLMASLSSVFGGLATLLAAVGLYGVLSYTVARRTREIGIRMALGALRSRMTWVMLREAAVLVGSGLVLGLGAAWWLTRYVESQLYDVKPTDPVAIAACGTILIGVAFVASLVPARRAARIDPMTALRSE